MRLCHYLLQQGYPADVITLLTAYTGQVLVVKDIMSKDKDFYSGTAVSYTHLTLPTITKV